MGGENSPLYRATFFVLGTLFGYVLIRAGVSSYDVIRDMFLLRSFHMYGVLGVAVPITFVAAQLWKRWGKKPLLAEHTDWHVDQLSRNHVLGGLLSGAGWALTGACPGPALALLGFGVLSALFIVLGILAGTWFYAWLSEPKSH